MLAEYLKYVLCFVDTKLGTRHLMWCALIFTLFNLVFRPLAIRHITYRVRVALYLIAVPAVIGVSAGLVRLSLYAVCMAVAVTAGVLFLWSQVSPEVTLTIHNCVEVDTTRNDVDVNFLQASDKYVRATAVFGGRVHEVACGNLGLARRAAAAVSTVDVHALAMIIAKDRNSGDEELKLQCDDDTLTLATCLVLKREQATRRSSVDAECQVFRYWQVGTFLKRGSWTAVPIAVAALIHPLALLGTLLLRGLLFEDPKPPIQRVCGLFGRIGTCLLHSSDLSYKIIKKATRGVVRGLAQGLARSVRAVQVGPLLRNPRYYASGTLELLRSLIYRSARHVPEPDREALTRFIEHGVKPALAQAFPNGVDYSVPLDIRQVILDQNYPASKTRAYLRALDGMGLVDGRFVISSTVKAFIKQETYADYSKEPRTIQCLPIPDRIISLYYYKKLSDAFFSNRDVSLKHLPASQRPRALQELFGQLETVYSWDCSGFEASVSLPVEKALWETLVDTWRLPRYLVDFVCFEKTRINAHGLRYVGPHSRRSGDYWTSLSNSLVNLALQHYVAYESGTRVNRCIVEGDDCLVSYSSQVSDIEARQAFLRLGFVAKTPEVGTGPGSVAFCSTKFDPVDLKPTRDPRNIIDNIGVSFSPTARRDPAAAFAQRAASYSCDCPDQPITWVLANIAAEAKVQPEDLPWWYAQRARMEDMSRIRSPPTMAQRQAYAEMWDCPISVQLAIERCLITGCNFSSVPAIVDFRDAGRTDWDEVVSDEPYPDSSSLPIIRAHLAARKPRSMKIPSVKARAMCRSYQCSIAY